ncbi:hypothetical protein M0R72_12620 [Candidatus Pacearchaeota archaeon]|jgi:hypothetical protein|nr:hypothetical protein [Candidatus Pacearchaeota archaeon]
MRLLVTFEYSTILFGTDCDYAKIIGAVEGATVVEEEGPYDARFYKAKAKHDITIKLLADGDVRLPDVARPESVDRLLSLAKEKDALTTKVRLLEQELKKIKEAVTPPAAA